MNLTRLNEAFPEWKTGAIFAALNSFDMPWDSSASLYFDVDYFGNVSGNKICSPLVDTMLTDGVIPSADAALLAGIINSLFGLKWSKLWATANLVYNPIENYNMVEVMTNDQTVKGYGRTHTRTDNLSHAKTGTETQTPNTITSENNSVYGFNSDEAVPSDDKSVSNTGTNTLTYNTTDADTGTQTNNEGGQDTETRNYRLTRDGNIGVTTSQQMIESERELWRVWDFMRGVVYPDIDRVLTIATY